MPELQPFENLDAGGVDSRSNPLNMPRNRALRCLNWVPKQAGFWELRWGYSTVTMSTVSASVIHSMFPYRTWDGHKYVLFMSDDKSLKVLDTATGTVTTPTVKGTAIASTSKGAGFFAANRFHYGNGTDQKWFDGTNWRDSGLETLTVTQLQGIVITEGARELTPTEASTITLTPGGGGSFPGDTIGRSIYVALFDTAAQVVGPATIAASTGTVIVPLNDLLAVANMPDLSGAAIPYIKLMAGTGDGGDLAYFFTNTQTNITSCTRAGPTLTIVAAAHGLSFADPVIIAGTSNFDGVYNVSNVVDANTVKVNLQAANLNANTGAVGTIKRIVNCSASATSINIDAATQDTSYQVNQNRGFAASTVGGPNPGYQLSLSIYNPNGGGHVGNYVNIGSPFVQTAYRCCLRITGLPDLGLTDSEWAILFGRTIDGGAVPYVCTDPVGNWAYEVSSQSNTGSDVTSFYLTEGVLDPNHQMPYRNTPIPSQCNMFCVAGDYCVAGDTGSPYLRFSGNLAENTEQGDTFTGRAEQSWAADDIQTFPTGEALTGIFPVDQEVFAGTLHDSGICTNLAGIWQWVGPWAVGIAGIRAGAICGSHGFCWVSGDKQLCTLVNGVPTVISEEYELAELSRIGDSYLNTVEVSYFRSAEPMNKDEIRIGARKSDGTPYTIIHDFKLREVYTPPGSIYGQGYSSQFAGPLATAFTTSQVRDGNGKLQVYAGASTGRIYCLYSGADDASNQYTADLILLINGGPGRPDVPFVDFYGDQEIQFTLGRNLSSSIANGAQWGFDPPNSDADDPQSVPGAEQDFLYRVWLVPPEVQRLYLRMQLTSHSADGNLELNDPPHVPLESYGRLYEFVPATGDERDR